MPAKYQPEYNYVKSIPARRVHLFTAIQVVCLILLLVIKKIKVISIGFPIMVSLLVYDTGRLEAPRFCIVRGIAHQIH